MTASELAKAEICNILKNASPEEIVKELDYRRGLSDALTIIEKYEGVIEFAEKLTKSIEVLPYKVNDGFEDLVLKDDVIKIISDELNDGKIFMLRKDED